MSLTVTVSVEALARVLPLVLLFLAGIFLRRLRFLAPDTAELPVGGQVLEASPDRPYLREQGEQFRHIAMVDGESHRKASPSSRSTKSLIRRSG